MSDQRAAKRNLNMPIYVLNIRASLELNFHIRTKMLTNEHNHTKLILASVLPRKTTSYYRITYKWQFTKPASIYKNNVKNRIYRTSATWIN